MQDRIAVQSRDIAIIGYDSTEKTLEVAFRTGGVYRYGGVPRDIYEAFMGAESHGGFFQEHIRNCYPYTRVYPN